MTELLVNETMDAQADEAWEAGDQVNGSCERGLATGVGTISLRTPRSRRIVKVPMYF